MMLLERIGGSVGRKWVYIFNRPNGKKSIPDKGVPVFSWIPIYIELAKKILPYRNRQNELLKMLEELQAQELPVGSIIDRDKKGKEIPLEAIDPFTFFSCFNRNLTSENKRDILSYLKTKFDLTSEVPTDFDGIPVVDARRAWFFPYSYTRERDDIPSLWSLAEAVVKGQQLDAKLFERCLHIVSVGKAKLTIGMFWLNPKRYLPLDANSCKLLEQNDISADVKNLSAYMRLLYRAS